MLKIKNESFDENKIWDNNQISKMNMSDDLLKYQPFQDNIMPLRKSLQPLSE
jgi:hypothetical protein